MFTIQSFTGMTNERRAENVSSIHKHKEITIAIKFQWAMLATFYSSLVPMDFTISLINTLATIKNLSPDEDANANHKLYYMYWFTPNIQPDNIGSIIKIISIKISAHHDQTFFELGACWVPTVLSCVHDLHCARSKATVVCSLYFTKTAGWYVETE